MKIILEQEDLKSILEEKYGTIKELVIDDKEVIITIDSNTFVKQSPQQPPQPPIVQKPRTLEEKQTESQNKGTMGVGGQRVITRKF